MDESAVGTLLRSLDSRWDTPVRRRTLARLSAIYESNRVLGADGFAPQLQRCCPSAADCWKEAQDRLQPPQAVEGHHGPCENGSIVWPWVGEHYRAGGVCVVALNINHADSGWWSIAVEYAIERRVIDGFAAGRKAIFGSSLFHYRASASAHAALSSLAGKRPVEAPEPQELAGVAEAVARVQAVKCSPLGNKSYPTPQMRANCPGRFAQREMALLRPSVLVGLGVDARTAVQALGDVTWTEERDQFARATLGLPHGVVEFLAVPHPNARGRLWATGQQRLVASLIDKPLIA